MSRAQTPNTPRANNNTHPTTTNDIPSPSSSLHPSSLGALKEKADDDMSVRQHSEDGTGQAGNGLSGEGDADGSAGGKEMDNMEDAKEPVEEFDWEGLEGRFWDRMDECRRVEEGLREEFEEVIKVCFASSSLLQGLGVVLLWCGWGLREDFGADGRVWGNWADGRRSSMRGRLLVPWARRTELRSGMFFILSPFFSLSLSPQSHIDCVHLQVMPIG